ncbi:MAG: peptide-methionine (S)-S-oxide reductase MsrA [Alphaproteobacteria bacterium]|nr:peptide-methionine (S)-S-oxide reductase MsrA [Alphaproteobacteria bacterium]MDE2163767.1 peptide-methionine (S)-S-oxide reductase MsrA [Alphaproteobacteria bacterium]MDE2266612.1 peptide-methionine (S)-S-oxide reductase MsrA [Alphaproteobacteria bacterium]MDE2500479.1 peptide-methionine (S)-S-oxide reductase MsrA [Alphaproteobacteria bacterium]
MMTGIIRPLAVAALLAMCASPSVADETANVLPSPMVDNEPAQPSETAVLAGGCFWGMQGVFQHVKGVKQVLAGYSGGARDTAHYEEVGSGTTGNAESVQIVFDPKIVSYGQILRIYFSVMDPTTLDYQGPDEGTQYRSEIFYANPDQLRIAKAYVAQLSKAQVFSAPIVTQIGALHGFYPAEAYHQDYLILHPYQPYIVINDLPKIAKLKHLYPQFYAEKPVRVTQN